VHDRLRLLTQAGDHPQDGNVLPASLTARKTGSQLPDTPVYKLLHRRTYLWFTEKFTERRKLPVYKMVVS
jgi:hypothetical protein